MPHYRDHEVSPYWDKGKVFSQRAGGFVSPQRARYEDNMQLLEDHQKRIEQEAVDRRMHESMGDDYDTSRFSTG